jgi:hypothetical protein
MVSHSDHIPYWYVAIGGVISLYQAYRGFMFQWIFGVEVKGGSVRKVLLLCLAEMFTYFIFAVSGFAALYISVNLPWNDPVNIVLFLYGILSVTGKLPDILHRVSFPSQR